jgi:hypothetical protein
MASDSATPDRAHIIAIRMRSAEQSIGLSMGAERAPVKQPFL